MPILATRALASARGFGFAGGAPFFLTISSNQTNVNLRTFAISAGWNGSSRLIATINSGIFISSNSTGTPALTVNGSFPGGVELVNNGTIVGMGGNGGRGWGRDANAVVLGSLPGGAGGTALSVSVALSLRNNSTIAGGGGGGGGGGGALEQVQDKDGNITNTSRPGSGGGGGRSSAAANSSGGIGGRADLNFIPQSAFPGSAGTVSAAGARGSITGIQGNDPNSNTVGGGGGNGGNWGAAGGNGERYRSGVITDNGGAGGGGGAAVSGNINITYLATGTRLGAIT